MRNMESSNGYVLVCPKKALINCKWINVNEFTEQSVDTSFLKMLNEPFIDPVVFWSLIGKVAIMWGTAYVIRQILNLVQFRR